MKAFIAKNIDELSEKFADWLVDYADEVLKKQDRFTIALSGGSTPKKLYQLLASDKYKSKIDWSKLHFFWGDERFVPFADESNNAKMAFDELLDHVPVNKEHIHVMQTMGQESEESASNMKNYFMIILIIQQHTFDLVLLGLGDDAHTLSLFPGYEVVAENKKWVSAFYLKEQEMYRITLTAAVVNKAVKGSFFSKWRR